MSEYTPITTDMRLLLGCFTKLTDFERDKFTQLCDAIDSIHAQLERENEALRSSAAHAYASGYEYAEQDRDGWMELPKDADGVPIRVGDVMVYADGNTCPLPVVALVPPAVFLTDDGPCYADMCRHAPDTWERIIEELLQRGHDDYPLNVDIEPYVARCKALCERIKEDE